MAVITVVDTSIQTSVVPCNCTPWWRGAGIVIPTANCIAAYTPIGATSKANSLINNANPGTYDGVEVGTVTWNAVTGWTFNGTNNGVDCNLLSWSDATCSLFVRFSGVSAKDSVVVAGYTNGTDSQSLYMNPLNGSSNIVYNSYAHDDTVPGSSSGVIGMAGRKCFKDTNLVLTLDAPGTPSSQNVSIGYNKVSGDSYMEGNVLAVAIYDIELTEAQATALVVAMLALPDYADGDKTPAEA